MSHKNDLSACIKWRAGNANGGRLEESPRAGKLSNGTFARQGCFWGADCPEALPGRAREVGAIEAVVVLSLCQIQLGLIGVRGS